MITATEARKISNQPISEDIKQQVNRDITKAAEKGKNMVMFCFSDDTEHYLFHTVLPGDDNLIASIKTMLEELGYNVKEVNQGKFTTRMSWFFGTHWEHYLEVSW